MSSFDIEQIEERIVRFRNGGSIGPEPRTLDECEWLIGEVRMVQRRLDLADRELARFRARDRSRRHTAEREGSNGYPPALDDQAPDGGWEKAKRSCSP